MTTEEKPQIRVQVRSQYIPHQSLPEEDRYFFSYTVEIQNLGPIPAKLVRRHWVITDAEDEKKEVQGLGVVGEQPFIQAGASYRYTSCALLKTPVGTMHGSYTFITEQGHEFEAPIAPFRLADPALLN